VGVLMTRPNWAALERRVSRHGKVCWYVRIGHGERTRLLSALSTPEFRAEYEVAFAAALKGEKPPKPKDKGPSSGTLNWLWAQYSKSSAWGSLSLSTQRQRENIMKHVLASAGAIGVEKITKAIVVAGRERRQKTPSQANNYLNCLRSLFAWAVESEFMPANPTDGVANLTRPKSGGFPEWTEEDVAKYEAYWKLGTRERLAFAVHLYTGLRRGDAVRLGRQHFKKGVIEIKAEKNGVDLTIPIHPRLVEAIKACPISNLHILEKSNGKNWGSKESYGNTFHEWALQAGVVAKGQPKNSHGIRKCAATRVAEAGASELELMALFGWTDPGMARLYTKSANAKQLALQAASKVAGFVSGGYDLFQD
jgi:integrase